MEMVEEMVALAATILSVVAEVPVDILAMVALTKQPVLAAAVAAVEILAPMVAEPEEVESV